MKIDRKEVEALPEKDDTVAIIAAMVQGDRWLSASTAAVYMGQIPRKSFLALACKPGFPVPTWLGKHRTWRKSELDEWMKAERSRQQRQRAA